MAVSSRGGMSRWLFSSYGWSSARSVVALFTVDEMCQVRHFAARKGTREKIRKKKVKVEVKKVEFIPHNLRNKNKLKAPTMMKRVVDFWKKESHDDVWIAKYHRWRVYSFQEAVSCHRETHHPTVYNIPDAPLNIVIELDMKAEKKNKFLDNLNRIVAVPYAFDQGEERAILALCKTPELQKIALEAGANLAGDLELIKDIQNTHSVRQQINSHCFDNIPKDLNKPVPVYARLHNQAFRTYHPTKSVQQFSTNTMGTASPMDQSGEVSLQDFQFVVAHLNILPELSSLRGLMKRKFPTTKTGIDAQAHRRHFKVVFSHPWNSSSNHCNGCPGNLGADLATMVSKFRYGIQYTSSKDEHEEDFGRIEVTVGKLDMEASQLEANFAAIIQDVLSVAPKKEAPFVTRCLAVCPPSVETLKLDIEPYVGLKSQEKSEEVGEEDEGADEVHRVAASS
uniref:Mitochondrial ribosomal protein L1 n=1 Tax=Timema shepardi TaxID=629360 RepID=A0A7R9AYW8_TIMSH|nr:unnamed protein product [Timema shepardi]